MFGGASCLRPFTLPHSPILVVLAALLAALGCFVALPTVAHAAARATTIIVNTPNTVITDDGDCGLLEAIIAANNNAALNGCPAGQAAPAVDVIQLSSITYTLQDAVDFGTGPSGTPPITSPLIIEGNGATIERNNAAPELRILRVAGGGDLTLDDVTLFNGFAPTARGAAIHNEGTLNLSNSRLISNTALYGGGLANGVNALANIENTSILTNSADIYGGGLYVDPLGDLLVTNVELRANKAENGGGLYALNTDSVRVMESDFISNSAELLGGALFAQFVQASIEDSIFISNTSDFRGGALYVDGNSVISMSTSQLRANGAQQGGALYLFNGATQTIAESVFISNTATQLGGGIVAAEASALTLNDVELFGNSADDFGGGLLLTSGSVVTISNSLFQENNAANGGALLLDGNSAATLTNVELRQNVVTLAGAAIYVSDSQLNATGSRFFSNSATAGSALYHVFGTQPVQVSESCIVNNSDNAVELALSDPITATQNWWGAADGPSGVGPGSGDSVGIDVIFTDFKTSPILGCPFRANVSLSKQVLPTGTLLPGQPVTYTITITNNEARPVNGLFVDDPLPVPFQLAQLNATGATVAQVAAGFTVSNVPSNGVATLQLLGAVDATLNNDTLLTNTATLSETVNGLVAATVSNQVQVPVVQLNAPSFSANESTGGVTVTLSHLPANPFAADSVDLESSESTLLQAATVQQVTALQTITFPAASDSQSLFVPFSDDDVVVARTLNLALQSPLGVRLGNAISATATIAEDDQAALTLAKRANVSAAVAGEAITYSYAITNTGSVTLTVTASDDKLGAIAGLAGTLTPLAARVATLPYTVQGSDPLGALTNRVTVTATYAVAGTLLVSDTVTVNIAAPPTPRVPSGGSYLPRIGKAQ